MKILVMFVAYFLFVIAGATFILENKIDDTLFLTDEARAAGISIEDVEIINDEVTFSIKTTKNTSCKDILTALELSDVWVGNSVYTPMCNRINSKLVRIKFSKSTPV